MSDTRYLCCNQYPYVITAEGQTKKTLLVRSGAYQTTQAAASLPLHKWVIDNYGFNFRDTSWRQVSTWPRNEVKRLRFSQFGDLLQGNLISTLTFGNVHFLSISFKKTATCSFLFC